MVNKKIINEIAKLLQEEYPLANSPSTTKKPTVPSTSRQSEEDRFHDNIHTEEQDIQQEGVVANMLVKLKIISPEKFIDAIFKAVEKKVKGIEKKSRVNTEGEKVINIASALGYVGKKGGDIDLAEVKKSVQELKMATKDFVQKYDNLTGAMNENSDKYLPLDTVRNMLVMAMAVGQISDIIQELNTRIEDNTTQFEQAVDDTSEEEQPSQEPEVGEPVNKDKMQGDEEVKDASAKAVAIPAKEVEKVLDDRVEQALDKALDDAEDEPDVVPTRAQYKGAADEINLAFNAIKKLVNWSDSEIDKYIQNLIVYGKIDLNDKENVAPNIILKAIAGLPPEDVKDPIIKQSLEDDIPALIDKYATMANEGKLPSASIQKKINSYLMEHINKK